MPLIRNAAYNIAERIANVLPLADATVVYQHAALGLSSGRVRPLQSGDTFAGFAGRRVDSRALATGAPPEQVPIIRAGEALLPIAGSVGASVYATADDTFSTAGGSYIGKVVRLEGAGSWVAFEAQSGGAVPGDGNSAPAPVLPFVLRDPAALAGVFPVAVRKTSAGYLTNFNFDDWRTPTSTTLWVSKARGNDTTGTGTYAAPYRGVKKALTMISAGAATTIMIESGYYDRSISPNGTGADADLNIIAVGNVVLSCAYEPLTWIADGGGVYRVARSAVASVRSNTEADEYGQALEYTKVATLAACQAAGGTWYTDGTTLYVHRTDDAAPTNGDFSASTIVLAELASGWLSVTAARRHCTKGVVFEGGMDGAWRSSGSMSATGVQAIFEDCTFRYASTNTTNGSRAPNGLSDVGLALCIAHRCIAHGNQSDGFNHHQGITNLVHPVSVEIDCQAYGNGRNNGIDSNNGFTQHEDGRGLRVNCVASGHWGPEFADIDTSRTLNIGCRANDSLATTVASQNASFQALHTAHQYNVDCVADGANWARYVAAGATMQWTGGQILSGETFGTVV